MYGDIKEEFSTPLNSFVNTLFFSLLGEVEIDTILPLDSSEAPLFLQFFFLDCGAISNNNDADKPFHCHYCSYLG